MTNFAVGTVFKASARAFIPATRAMIRGLDKVGRAALTTTQRVNRAMLKMGKGMIAPFTQFLPALGAAGLGVGLKKIVDAARMIEDAEAAFTPLLGGAKKAKDMVDALNTTAASTPFQFETLSKSAKQLLPVMKGDIQNTIKTIRMLGDTAGGNAQKMESITRGYTKAMLKGKVDMESLNMIAEAGVPIFTEMATAMGYNEKQMSKFFKKISTGKVGTEELTKVFEKMTSKGGVFFEGMIVASKTTSGVISTAKDNITLFAASIGKQLLPYVKEVAIALTQAAQSGAEWIKNNKDVIGGFIKILVSVIKLLPKIIAGWVALTTATKIYMITTKLATMWTKRAAIAQKVLNFVMKMNPIGLVITAIAALVAGIIYLVKNWDELKESMKDTTWGRAILFIIDVVKKGIQELVSNFKMLGKVIDGDFTGAMREKAKSGMFGEITKQEAAKRNMTVDQYLDQKFGAVESPNKATENTQNINFQGNIDVNAPQGTTVNSKTRGGKKINMQLVGQN